MLDAFVQRGKKRAREDADGGDEEREEDGRKDGGDVVMNDDGTMSFGAAPVPDPDPVPTSGVGVEAESQ